MGLAGRQVHRWRHVPRCVRLLRVVVSPHPYPSTPGCSPEAGRRHSVQRG